jgi:hypothetical protein
MVLVPVPVTKPLVTSMEAMVELSDVFLMTMLPDSTSTASLKVSTMLLSIATLLALSAGLELLRVGSVESILEPPQPAKLSDINKDNSANNFFIKFLGCKYIGVIMNYTILN